MNYPKRSLKRKHTYRNRYITEPTRNTDFPETPHEEEMPLVGSTPEVEDVEMRDVENSPKSEVTPMDIDYVEAPGPSTFRIAEERFTDIFLRRRGVLTRGMWAELEREGVLPAINRIQLPPLKGQRSKYSQSSRRSQ
ncbi:unnamed protein product [Hermetia illucens]|uniref:Uncharacterized protein n=1 Tax=Hermetia illucens TaxID=343691 RepID=A0A7R8V7B2_HERIL|nr:unnamed protein product [Hermetia illucens]